MGAYVIAIVVPLAMIAWYLSHLCSGLDVIFAALQDIRGNLKPISRIYERQKREHRRLDREFADLS